MRSVSEALQLESLGVDVIGVDVQKDRLFDDDRLIAPEVAAEIAAALTRASLAVAAGPANAEAIQQARRLGATYLEVDGRQIPNEAARREVHRAGLQLVFARIGADHDDDPGWLLSHFAVSEPLCLGFFELQLLVDVESSWVSLRDCAPGEDGLRLDHVADLARDNPLRIALDFGPDGVAEILERLPGVPWSLTLGRLAPDRHDVHVHTFEEVLSVLERRSRS